LNEEVQLHIERETAKYVAVGTPPEEALRRARLMFGGLEQTKERSRDARGVSAFENGARNLRFGIRVLRKSPAFTVVAVLSLALGIGANTAIFQLLNAVRLRALPVQEPRQLAEVRITDMDGARGNFERYPAVTNSIWEQIRDRQQILSGVFAWSQEDFDTSPGGETHSVRGLWVSGNFFDVLAVRPIRGRLFVQADDRRGCGLPGAVISYEFWQRQFGGEPAAIGRKLALNGHTVDVIGITPASFFGLEVGRTFDVALPICSDDAMRAKQSRLDAGTTWWLTVMGRMKPGSTLPQVSSYFNSLSPALFQTTLPSGYPPVSVKSYLGFKLQALSAANGTSDLRERYSDPLWLLLAISGAVLLIACVNLANLMLARASARERDIALRLAIGASRGQVIQQLMTESLLLALAGAALALPLALELSRLLLALLSTDASMFVDLSPDWRVFAFTAGLAALACLLFGMTPALRATRRASAEMLKAGSHGMTASRERLGLRRVLVAFQVALSLVLLTGALLFARTLHNLMTVSPGFKAESVLIAQVNFGHVKLTPERIPLFRRNLIDRLNGIPGVVSAAQTSVVPLSGDASGNTMWMDGTTRDHGALVLRAQVGVGYFKTLAIPLLAGRVFDDHDTTASPRVAIVNEAFVRKFVNGSSPLSRTFRVEATPFDPEASYEIVGLVKDTKYQTLREDFKPIAFFAASQDRLPVPEIHVLIRSSVPMDGTVAAVKNTLQEMDPAIKFDFTVFETQMIESLLTERLMATLSSAFGLLAGLLAAVGLYGVIAYMVVQRQHEIGIRMALGAGRRSILVMVMCESGKLLAVGLAAGAALTLALARTARSLLFGLQPTDTLTLLTALFILAVVALAASYLPARRAAALDPLDTLRVE
jgi:predicted permease